MNVLNMVQILTIGSIFIQIQIQFIVIKQFYLKIL